MQIYKFDDSEDALIYKVLFYLIFWDFVTYIDIEKWYFNLRCTIYIFFFNIKIITLLAPQIPPGGQKCNIHYYIFIPPLEI